MHSRIRHCHINKETMKTCHDDWSIIVLNTLLAGDCTASLSQIVTGVASNLGFANANAVSQSVDSEANVVWHVRGY